MPGMTSPSPAGNVFTWSCTCMQGRQMSRAVITAVSLTDRDLKLDSEMLGRCSHSSDMPFTGRELPSRGNKGHKVLQNEEEQVDESGACHVKDEVKTVHKTISCFFIESVLEHWVCPKVQLLLYTVPRIHVNCLNTQGSKTALKHARSQQCICAMCDNLDIPCENCNHAQTAICERYPCTL